MSRVRLVLVMPGFSMQASLNGKALVKLMKLIAKYQIEREVEK